jgi:hypothetical protein
MMSKGVCNMIRKAVCDMRQRPIRTVVPSRTIRIDPNWKRGARLTRLCLALWLALLLCFAVVPHGGAQQTGEFEWLLQFGLSGNDFAWDVHADGDGNVYVAGDSSGALPGQAFAGGAFDAYLRKYDADGNELWTRQFGTTGSDRNAAVFAFGADVYVGWLTTGAFPSQVNAGGVDAYLRKYDANGNEQWIRQFGTPGFDELRGVFADATGVYASGNVDGALPGQTHEGMFDAFVRKYDLDGNELWTRQFGTANRDISNRISGDDSGIYAVGRTDGALPGQTFAGVGDAFVRKYDFDGHELWTRQFGTPGIDSAIGVSTNATGVYVAGRTDRGLPGQTHAGGADAFVRQYDADGNELWTRQFGTPGFDLARGVSVRDSVVYVSGIAGAAGPADQVGADVFVQAYTARGTDLWTREFGSELADDNWAVSAASSGLYVIGSTGGTLPGLVSQGAIDAFVGKLVTEIASEIDIKPGSDLNHINLGPGVLPVAILSSNAFDATTVDPTTVILEGAGVRLRGQGQPMASVEDVNGDGLDDLVVHVEKAALELTSTDAIAELTARTFGGRVVFGFDSVSIVP